MFTMANSLKVAAAVRRRLTPLGTTSFMTSSCKATGPKKRRSKEVRLKR